MKSAEACEILGLTGEATAETILIAFRRAAMKYHPDRGGSTEMMQAVNAAYAALEGFTGTAAVADQEGYGEALNEAINALTGLGLSLEVCGLWLWVSGDTRTHKESLKAAGYRWASKKMQWYFRPDGWKSTSRGAFSMNDIREKYGSESVHQRQWQQMAN